MDQLQAQYEDQCGEEGGLLLTAAMFVLAMVAMVQGCFSRKKKIWDRVVSAKEGGVYILEKARKHRITLIAWKVKGGGDGKRYIVVYSVQHGTHSWCLYGYNYSREEWTLTNDGQIATALWKDNCEFLSDAERRDLIE